VGVAVTIVSILLHVYVEYNTLDRIYNAGAGTSVRNDAANGGGKPLLVLEQYMAQHSVESLQRQPGNRTYAIAYYSCPHRAGNFLHAFFNTVIWAIIHNRTVLWKFEPVEAFNLPEYCNTALRVRRWVPAYEEWNHNLSEPVAVKMNTRKRAPGQRFYTRQEQLESLTQPQVVVFPQIPDIQPQHPPDISPVSWWEDPARLTQPVFRNVMYYQRTVHLPDRNAQQTLQALYDKGIYFLYGMILKHFFELDAALIDPVEDDDGANRVSVALHSRHASVLDDGSNVQAEIRCLQKLLPRRGTPCTVFLMSDREATLERLQSWLQEDHLCRVVVYPHEATSLKQLSAESDAEHGPFAGMLFLADLATASQARTGVIGDFTRSSTALLLEMITYAQGLENHPPVQVCALPDRNE
jgi:hypothetical protein